MSYIKDANIDVPVEVDQSPKYATDETTYALQITRRYAVLTTKYVPLAQGSVDPVYKSAVLISEATESIQGPVTFFNRVYSQIPGSRIEYRQIPFTIPGRSQATISQITAQPIGWDPYGAAAPSTSLVLASVTYNYSTSSTSGNVLPTQIKYNGAVVDYTGDVFIPVGLDYVSKGGGIVVENRWRFVGSTVPGFASGVWIASSNVTRWKGPIWQAEVVRVTL